jgi:two-component system CheB/CheR fusion protein
MPKKTKKTHSKTKRRSTVASARVVRLAPSRSTHREHPSKTARPRAQVVSAFHAESRTSDGVTIVGVGASAGGLEAFSSLIGALPPKPGFAVVLVQHLAPQHESALPTLLTSYTTMPVLQVTDGMPVEANHVYVIPPNFKMGITDGHFELKPRADDRTQYTPVDSFLTSLAEHAESRAIAVILSGTASDGAIGVREIKAGGGITFAQKPETAKYDGMPRAAIATGMVDMVLSPAEIATKLTQVSAHPYVREFVAASAQELPVRDEQLRRIFDLLRPASGIDFRHYKLPTIKRRLLRRMALHRLTDVQHYVKFLEQNSAEVKALYQDLLIHVTRFFREPESFVALAQQVFPRLVEDRRDDQPIRAWVSGCATGEEAYSLAISLLEFLHRQHLDAQVQIFATDVSETAIEHARAGLYAATIEGDVPPDILRRYFTKVDGNYRVSKTVRDLCVFARQDLTKDPPFSRLDLILCRNVLIYMDVVLQQRLISVFHYALNPQGFLVLGQAETVGAQVALFSLADKKFRIYRRKAATRAPMAIHVDYTPPGYPKKRQTQDAPQGEKALQTEVSRIIFDRYAPPGVVVDNEMQIVQFRGQTGAYLEPAPGEASLNLLKMAREGLLYGLRTAMHAVRKSKVLVRKKGLRVRSARGWKAVNLDIVPLTTSGRPHYLVLFQEPNKQRDDHDDVAEKVPAKALSPRAKSRERQSQLDLLERELAASRDYLQSIIQELEAANEELQSANEEILSSNEELQSTNEELDTAKEELQSTNEELNTLNEELHGRNEELSRVNSDLVNLLASVQIAIVIISSDLRIRRFTPMAEKALNLIPSDLDRPIGHIKPNIVCPDLERLILESIDSVAPIEREVRDQSGRWYSLRIRPYKNVENKIDGAVLTLFDVDLPKRSEERMRLAKEYTDALMALIDQPIVVLDSELRVQAVSDQFARVVGVAQSGIVGRHVSEIDGTWNLGALQARLRSMPSRDGGFDKIPIDLDGENGTRRTVFLSGRWLQSHELPDTQVLVLALAGSEPGALSGES